MENSISESSLANENKHLKTQLDFYQKVFDNSHGWESFYDFDGNFTFISAACEKISGYKPDEFIENPDLFQNIIHPEDSETVKYHVNRQYVNNPQEQKIEFRIITKKGEEKWISQYSQPIFRNEKWIGQISSNRDITEIKKKELLLKQQTRELEVFNHILISAGKCSSLSELFETTINEILNFLDFDGAAIYLVDENEEYANIVYNRHLEQDLINETGKVEIQKGKYRKIFVDKQPIFTENYQDIDYERSKKYSILSLISIPLISGDKAIGALNIKSGKKVAISEFEKIILLNIGRELGSLIQKEILTERLKSNKQNFDNLINTIQDFVFVLDLQGNIIYFNKFTEERLLYSNTELVGKHILKIHPEKNIEEATLILKDIIEGDKEEYYLPIVTKKGEIIEVQSKISKGIWNNQLVLFDTCRDITRQIQFENEIQLFFDVSLDLLCFANFEGYFTRLSPTWSKKLGWTDEELMSRPFIDFVHPDDKEDTLKATSQLNKGIDVIGFDNRYLCKDGNYKWISWNSFGLVERRLIIAAARDITDRKESENKLKKERDYNILLTETSPIGIVNTNAQGEIIFANKQAEKIFGLNKFDITSRTYSAPEWKILDIEGNPFPLAELPFIRVKSELHTVMNIRHSIEYPNGKRIFLSINASPVINESGEFEGMIASIEDISELIETEKALKHEYDFRTSIIKNAAEGLCVCHEIPDFPFVEFTVWNDQMKLITGYTMDEINQYGWYQSMYPNEELQKKAIERMSRMRIGDNLHSEPWTITRADKERRIINITTSSLITKEGTAHVLGIMDDVTEQIKAVQKLKEEHNFRSSIIEHAAEGLCVWKDTDHFPFLEFIVWNDQMIRITGYTSEEINSLGIFQTILKEPKILKKTQEQLDHIKNGGNLKNQSWEIIRKDEAKRFINITTSRIYSEDGNFHILALMDDITDKKKAEEKIHRLNQFQQAIIENANVLISVIDKRGYVVIWNKAAEKITGYTREEVVGNRLINDLIIRDPGYKKEVWQIIQDILAGKNKGENINLKINRKDGEERTISFFVKVFTDNDGKLMEIVNVGIDVTDSIKIEQELRNSHGQLIELINTKDKFFNIIAHDLKAPFNSLIGFSEIIIDNIKESNYDKVEKYTHYIYLASKKVYNLLDNLLTWALSQTGKITVNPQKIILNNILRESIDVLLFSAINKNISIENLVEDNAEAYADEDLIRTVVRNLLSNAIKFTNIDGKIKIYSSIKENDIEICIEDNGIGITEEDLKKLFRLDVSLTIKGTSNEKGTGLGLILCKEFINKNNGNIWVTSEINKGSKFCFSLPRMIKS